MFKITNVLNEYLINKFNRPGPYYTSYPVLSEWSRNIMEKDYLVALSEFTPDAERGTTGLYIHFPFCPKRCYYCMCNSIITHDRKKIDEFLQYLLRELDMLFEFFVKWNARLCITDIHLGGGSPSFMNEKEFSILIGKIKSLVDEKDLQEFSIEVDPRTATLDKLSLYHDAGINRVSFGIQDLNPQVQKAVNREHSFELVQSLLTPKIRGYFGSINFDIIYGLPLQTRESFRETIEAVKELSPDRITFLRYAHIPEIRKHQKLLEKYEVPDNTEKAWMFFDTLENLKESGWEHIGIDHFAKPSNTLARAQRNKTMKRTFIGYQSGKIDNILGLGPSSTSKLNNYYFQNVCSLNGYYEGVSSGNFPICQGYKLTSDDLIRRDVINTILCSYGLDFDEIERRHKINFNVYFERELLSLNEFVDDGMVERTPDGVRVTDLGRGFIRHVCKVFDSFLKNGKIYKISGP